MTKERHMEIIKSMIAMPEDERMEMINSGMFNSIIQGYLVATLENMKMDEDTIKAAAYELYHNVFDTMNAAEAKEKAIY